MLVCRLEILQHGLHLVRPIGSMGIASRGSTDGVADYVIVRDNGGTVGTGMVKQHRRADGAWTLLGLACADRLVALPNAHVEQAERMLEKLRP